MRKIVFLLFFASGCTALIYEIAWIKLLSYIFGSTVYAISTVLTVFMAGLAVGGYLIGRYADRIKKPLGLYGALEFLIGLFALLFLFALGPLESVYVWIERSWSLTYTSFSLVKFALTFLLLILPTTMMGGTLPVMAKHISRSEDKVGKDIGLLYGANVLGAVTGCLLTAFVLINSFGINNTIYLAVVINTLIALLVLFLVLSRKATGEEISESYAEKAYPAAPDKVDIDETLPDLPGKGSPSWALYLAAFSGFATMALEVLWTRTFISMLSANVLIFAVILASFLSGLSLGSFLISRWIDRIRGMTSFIGILLLLNGLVIVLSILGLRQIGNLFEYLHFARSFSPLIDDLGIWSHFIVLFVIILIPSVAMGTVFPAVIKYYSRSLASLGRDVGHVYAVNTVGAILGSFSAGFVLTPLIGINQSVYAMGAIYSLLAVITFMMAGKRNLLVGGVLLTLFSLIAIPFTSTLHWFNAGFIRTNVISPEHTLFYREGVSANIGIIKRNGFKALAVDGIIVAQNSKDDMWDLLLKAHLPVMLHPDPQKVLLIGLGGGISLGAVEKHDVEEIDCVELSPEVVDAHRYFAEENDRCWEDSRLNLIVNDGRHFLLTTEERYDIISVDPVDPPVSTLYTRDFFTLCRNALNEDGLMLQWVPLFRLSSGHVLMIIKSFRNVFPNTTVWYDGTSIFLLGRNGDQVDFDYSDFVASFSNPGVEKSLAKIGLTDPDLILATFVAPVEEFEQLMGEAIPENTDNHPRLEYSVLYDRGFSFSKNLELVSNQYGCISPHLTGIEDEKSIRRVERVCVIMKDLFQVRLLATEGRLNEAGSLLESTAARNGLVMKDVEILRPFWAPLTR
jgi:spermidine synthase